MDTLSHALWGGVAFGRRNKRSFLLASFFGFAPDIFSFGILFAANILGISERPNFENGPPDMSSIPAYVDSLYNATHSLIIFALVFGLVWVIRKKPLKEMGGWIFHILLDIPTHSTAFFATPFLWPLSSYKFDGEPWGNPWIFFPNVILLIATYSYFYIYKKRKSLARKH